jgi:ornithine cyclodeaminase/alanine dehydrogenase-like protein (mu-crystallin family)
MRPVFFTYLSQEDIISLKISMKEVIKVIEEALKAHALAKVEMPPKPGIHPRKDSFIHAMPAFIKTNGACGIKWVSGYPGNREKGLPQILGLLILNDDETGVPKCVMDCAWITAVRTAAVSAVSVRYLARKNADTVGIIGAGVQGRFNLMAFKEVLPNLKRVKIYDINDEYAKRFASQMSEELNLDIEVTKGVKYAVHNSDVVLTATQRLERPIIANDWFQKGSLGMGLEVARAWDKEILSTVDKFVTDDISQARYFDSQGAFPGGMPKPYAQLGEIVLGQKAGRQSNDERILAFNIGMALVDIAVGQEVFKKAKAKGVGQELLLMHSPL